MFLWTLKTVPPPFTLGSRGGGLVDSCMVLICKELLILRASHLPLMLRTGYVWCELQESEMENLVMLASDAIWHRHKTFIFCSFAQMLMVLVQRILVFISWVSWEFKFKEMHMMEGRWYLPWCFKHILPAVTCSKGYSVHKNHPCYNFYYCSTCVCH